MLDKEDIVPQALPSLGEKMTLSSLWRLVSFDCSLRLRYDLLMKGKAWSSVLFSFNGPVIPETWGNGTENNRFCGGSQRL